MFDDQQHGSEAAPRRLPPSQLRLAVGDAIRHHPTLDRKQTLKVVLEMLWREDPETVTTIYDEIQTYRASEDANGRHGLHAERLRSLCKPMPQRARQGLTLEEVTIEAEKVTSLPVDRSAVVSLLVHHGYLELVYFGGRQRRHLLTTTAFATEIGHNVHAHSTYSQRVGGLAKASPFPVIYPDQLSAVLWSLGLDEIELALDELPSKKAKAAWLITHHGYLPQATMALWSGMTERGIRKAVARSVTRGDLQPSLTSAGTSAPVTAGGGLRLSGALG